MASKIFEYSGKEIEVRYDLARCIHAAECIHGAPGVFDPKRKPWIDPDAQSASEIAEVIHRCPSGALSYVMADGSVEPPPPVNTIRVDPNGPLYVRGKIEVRTPEGEVVLKETRAAFCRCGLSKNKPYCDNSHLESDFVSDGILGKGGIKEGDPESDVLTVVPKPNASLLFSGSVTVRGADGEERSGIRTALCRCGLSANKPFCDKSHKDSGFEG